MNVATWCLSEGGRVTVTASGAGREPFATGHPMDRRLTSMAVMEFGVSVKTRSIALS